jgi:hypothetical protein
MTPPAPAGLPASALSPLSRRKSTFSSPVMHRSLAVKRGRPGRWSIHRSRVHRLMPAAFPAVVGKSATRWNRGSFTFLVPSVPANVLGMAHNTGRAGCDLPPQAFHKAATSVVGPGDAIELRPGVGHVDPEAELTIVVGSRARGLTLGTARSAILGFTIGNDVSARDLQKSDELWISAKSQDTFTPAGP